MLQGIQKFILALFNGLSIYNIFEFLRVLKRVIQSRAAIRFFFDKCRQIIIMVLLELVWGHTIHLHVRIYLIIAFLWLQDVSYHHFGIADFILVIKVIRCSFHIDRDVVYINSTLLQVASQVKFLFLVFAFDDSLYS